jgi:hypothetical protein
MEERISVADSNALCGRGISVQRPDLGHAEEEGKRREAEALVVSLVLQRGS